MGNVLHVQQEVLLYSLMENAHHVQQEEVRQKEDCVRHVLKDNLLHQEELVNHVQQASHHLVEVYALIVKPDKVPPQGDYA